MDDVERNLLNLGITLNSVSSPPANFVHAVTVGNLVFTSGADCKKDGKFLYQGKLGRELSTEEGYEAAKYTMINLLSILKEHLGNLNKVKRIVKLTVFVNCIVGYHEQPLVADGASDLLEEIFGEQGKHARTAVGVMELPFNIPVEIEMIVELHETIN